jgi:hypothetical protein
MDRGESLYIVVASEDSIGYTMQIEQEGSSVRNGFSRESVLDETKMLHPGWSIFV